MSYAEEILDDYIKKDDIVKALIYYRRVRQDLPEESRDKYDKIFAFIKDVPDGMLENREGIFKNDTKLLQQLLDDFNSPEKARKFIEDLIRRLDLE